MGKKTYEAQNQIVGLAKEVLELGQEVELDEKVAEPFVAGGSLKEVGARRPSKQPDAPPAKQPDPPPPGK